MVKENILDQQDVIKKSYAPGPQLVQNLPIYLGSGKVMY